MAPADKGKKRILLVHNAYQQRGGEDAVVEAEAALLQAHGHAVMRYERHNDELVGHGRLSAAADALWSTRTFREVQTLCRQWRPDIVHAHNTFPLVSPSLYWAADRARVPVVQTLHNFRLVCPQALMLRENKVCEDCVGRVPWRAVVHRCYRNSAPQSAVVAGTVQLHRWLGSWRDKVDRYIALNEFCRQKFIEGGLPAERISVKPNFVDVPPPPQLPRSGFLFVGRMSVEKGVATLAAAMAATPAGTMLRAIGEGPDSASLNGAAGIQVLGARLPSDVLNEMTRCLALVVPSIWYENFPRTVVEAFACGAAVIASRIGALATLVEHGNTGLLFDPGSPHDLARQMAWAQAHPAEMAGMGARARDHYERELTAEINYGKLMEIYRLAVRPPTAIPK